MLDHSHTRKRRLSRREAVQEFELDSFENQLDPTCQADMLHVMHVDKDDPNPGMPWASRLVGCG